MKTSRTIRPSLLVVFLAIPMLAVADFERGREAYNREDYATALREFRASAADGDAFSQRALGVMYSRGLGVQQDDAEAVRWYWLAAEQGQAAAQINLGFMYENGRGVPKDDAEAVRWYRQAAEQGYAGAQLNLGFMYEDGRGVPQDDAEAVRWYRLAAEQGYALAQFNLGVMYANGRGVPRNDAEAVRWYRQAAEQGQADAQFSLGMMYEDGRGVPQDHAEAVRWYRLAAEQGQAVAQFNLGVRYEDGRGVPRNDAEAVRWYRLAAEQAYAAAQLNLGFMYGEGQGVARNYVHAYMWGSLAAAQGNETARKNLQIIERQMSRAQIDEAQRLAASFRPGATTKETQSPAAHDRQEAAPPATPSATVRRIQAHLAALGYESGAADGVIGSRTVQAIKAFQEDHGIAPDGIASATLEAVLAALVEEGQQSPTQPSRVSGMELSSTGSGFFVTSQGHVLTNYHVVEGCVQMKVSLPGGAQDAKVQATSPDSDLAVIHVDTTPQGVAAFRNASVALGEDVLVAGYPLRGVLEGINVTAGSVSATSGIRNDRRYLQMTAPVQQGNSGGPLLDNAGSVVGVVVSKLNAIAVARATGDIPQNVNFAIKAAIAQSFLSIHDIDYREVPRLNRRDPGRVALAAEAQKYTVLVECWK